MVKWMIAIALLLGCIGVWGAATVEAAPPEKEFTDPATGMEFVWVSEGCFQMGDTFGNMQINEKPAHKVCVSGFYMGKHEVTQAQWQKLMDNNPSKFTNCGPTCPVEQVSWNDVQGYIAKLNASSSNRQYRLPTEAEWEYAARSGGKEEKWAGTSSIGELGEYAWFEANSGSTTHPVGQKRPNGLGLYDMSGNVWEWCSDRYNRLYYLLLKDGAHNPQGPQFGVNRVLRGGSWYYHAGYARSANRSGYGPGYRDNDMGFRLVSP
jgi:formylglycine-generating enzyme